jgi:hypothetical protein
MIEKLKEIGEGSFKLQSDIFWIFKRCLGWIHITFKEDGIFVEYTTDKDSSDPFSGTAIMMTYYYSGETFVTQQYGFRMFVEKGESKQRCLEVMKGYIEEIYQQEVGSSNPVKVS